MRRLRFVLCRSEGTGFKKACSFDFWEGVNYGVLRIYKSPVIPGCGFSVGCRVSEANPTRKVSGNVERIASRGWKAGRSDPPATPFIASNSREFSDIPNNPRMTRNPPQALRYYEILNRTHSH